MSSPLSSPPVTPTRPLFAIYPISDAEENPYLTDFIPSSPITGSTRAEKKKSKAAKRQRKRLAEQERKREELREERQRRLLYGAICQAAQQGAERVERITQQETKDIIFQQIMHSLTTSKYPWGELLLWISDPSSTCPAQHRYSGFFRNREQVKAVLDHWTSDSNCKSGKAAVREWALQYVERTVFKEGQKATSSGLLHSRGREVDSTFVLSFNLLSLYDQLKELCPNMTRILHTFSTTTRQRKAAITAASSEKAEQRKKQVRTLLYPALAASARDADFHASSAYWFIAGDATWRAQSTE